MANAEFRCISGSRIFFKSGENYQMFEASNLDTNVLIQIGFSWTKYKQQQSARNEQAKAMAEQEQQFAQYQVSLATNIQTFEVFSTSDGFHCEVNGGKVIFVKGLPSGVRNYFVQKDQLQQDIQDLENYHPTFTTTVTDPNDPDPGFTAQTINQEKVDQATEDKKEKLETMRESLMELNDEKISRTTIRAYFTGKYYGNSEIWRCVQ